MITYTIKEENENIKDAIIEKTGHSIQFTLQDMERNEQDLNKFKKECEATANNRKLTIENIESFHPFVTELSEEDLHTAFMYYKAKEDYKAYTSKRDEVVKVLNESYEEKVEIKKQLGIEDEPATEAEPTEEPVVINKADLE